MKLFLRVNHKMARDFVTHILSVEMPNQRNGLPVHRCVWVVADNPWVRGFLSQQEPECWERDRDGNIRLGISYSRMDRSTAVELSSRPHVTRVVTHHLHSNPKACNEHVGFAEWIGWCLLVPIVPEVSQAEADFRILASKTDLYYQYSDSIHVWRAGEARHKALMEEGKALGLSRDQMDQIIRSIMAK